MQFLTIGSQILQVLINKKGLKIGLKFVWFTL